MKMEFLKFFTAVTLWLVESTSAQTVFTKSGEEPYQMNAPEQVVASTMSSDTIHLTWHDPSLGRDQMIRDNRYYTIRYNSYGLGQYDYMNVTDLRGYVNGLQADTEYEFNVRVNDPPYLSEWSDNAKNRTTPFSSDVCSLPMDPGSCSDWEVHWFFNMEIHRCDRFWYGGCNEGNANNFMDEIECQSRCTKTPRTVQSSYQTCKPFRILFIWHTSGEEDESYIQQKRLILQLIGDLPEGTEVNLDTLDVSLNSLIHFKKDSLNSSWVKTVSLHRPGNSGNHTIPCLVIREAVYNYLNQIKNQKIANEITFVVNEKSIIDEVEKMKETLKHKLTFVVFSGMTMPPKKWTALATDNNHLTVLNGIESTNVKRAADLILKIFCQDSRLICDTDQFWTGKICYRCSHICSFDVKNSSKQCLKKCPYFGTLSTDANGQGVHYIRMPIPFVCAWLARLVFIL